MAVEKMVDPADLVTQFEAFSRDCPEYVIRLQGDYEDELFEVLIFKGFSSSTTHPTAFDPDRTVLLPGARLAQAELLKGPLTTCPTTVRGPEQPQTLLDFLRQSVMIPES